MEHIRKEHERDLEVEALTKEKTELEQANSEFEAKIQIQTEESARDKSDISKLEARLFQSLAEVDRLEKKEGLRKMTEDELVEARKEIVLQGELLRKYREKYLDKPLASAQEKESMYRENFHQQMEAVKSELLSKSTEADALKSRNLELEECQLRQEDAINAMKRQTKKICDEYNIEFMIELV